MLDDNSLKRVKKASKKERKDKKKKKKEKKNKRRRSSAADDAQPAAAAAANSVVASPDARNSSALKKRKAGKAEDPAVTISNAEEPGALENFPLHQSIVDRLHERGIKTLFDIQQQTFEPVFRGEDLVGRARTGTGKTFAFSLPVLSRLLNERDAAPGKPVYGRGPSMLVVAPTRELAIQVHNEIESVAPSLASVCIYGGSPYGPQESALRRGVDIVVSTVGRVIDHLDRGNLTMDNIKVIILDEADEMLNMGFVDDVERILNSAEDKEKQILLFSATVPAWVRKVAMKYLRKGYKSVDLVSGVAMKTAKRVSHMALCCSWKVRSAVLSDVIRVYGGMGKSIIFCNTKKEANDLATNSSIRKNCEVLHGDIVQEQREVTTQGFRLGRFKVLIATDVAARGLDIDDVDLIVQTEPPRDAETYIHRSGRTGRAGRSGASILFYQKRDQHAVKRLERAGGFQFDRIGTPQPSDVVTAAAKNAASMISKVDRKMVPFFKEPAANLIEKLGAETALALAMAQITGHTAMFKCRSLQSSMEGLVTLLATCTRTVNSPVHILNLLKKHLPSEQDVRSVKDISLLATRMGAVVDVPEALAEDIIEASKDDEWTTWEICEKLPDLAEKPQRGGGGRGGGYRGGRGGGGGYRGGRFGGNRGGRGRGGGRRQSWGNRGR